MERERKKETEREREKQESKGKEKKKEEESVTDLSPFTNSSVCYSFFSFFSKNQTLR